MSKVITDEVKGTMWSHWLDCIDHIPCAAYAVKNDDGLTLVKGNKAFYQLLDCSEEEMQLKYGNRLCALVDAEPIRKLYISDTEVFGPVSLKQNINKSNAEIWVETSLTAYPSEEGMILCCISTDITPYMQESIEFDSFSETVRIAAEQSNLDYFEYNFQTESARVLSSPCILPGLALSSDGKYHDFIEQIVANGNVSSEDEFTLRSAFLNVRGRDGRVVCELSLKNAKGSQIWTRLTLILKPNSNKVVGIWENITREKEMVGNYLSETQFYQAMLSEKTAYAQVDVTKDKITRIGGMWNLYNEIIDKVTYSQLISEFINKVVHPEDRKQYLEVMQTDNFVRSLDNGVDRIGCEFRRIVDQNKMMWMELSVYLFKDSLTHHVVALLTIKNIDARKKQELLLLHNSRMDQLTNIYNRKMSEGLICSYLASVPNNEMYAFAVLDVDDFKNINDSQGHAIGDQVLVYLSEILSSAFRKSDIIGRYGGDEFTIFLKNVASREQVSKRMEWLYQLLHKDSGLGPVACSTGIAMVRGPVSYKELFSQADEALYCAKREGKDHFVFYNHSSQEDVSLKSIKSTLIDSFQQEDMDITGVDQLDVQAVQEDSADFDSFIGEQGDIAYLVDPHTFSLICGNQAFYDRLGMSQEQCLGMKCFEVMHKRDTPCPFCSKANWSTDKFYLWRNLNLALEQEFLIKNKLVSWRGNTVLLAIAVDISNNKSIVDSMENEAMETHGILSGVQHMAEAETLGEAMESALEAIGAFFRCNAVRLWSVREGDQHYSCTHYWARNQQHHYEEDNYVIGRWLESCNWDQSIIIENPEAMLTFSYDMYDYMKEHKIHNQRWMFIKEGETELGYISMDNISSNFQNIAFLESFSTFMVSEFRKRSLIESSYYADQHDDLTDLLSRKNFEEYVLNFNPDKVSCLGVLMANFNNLKGINSIKGFQTGNCYIKQFADMLRMAFGEEKIFRLNGDEFLVVAPEITRNRLDDCVELLETAIDENGAFTVSIGHSWDDVENNLSVLIEQAVQRMKTSKRRYYDATPDIVDTERRRMLSELMAAIENNEFEVFLQPKVELLHGTVVGAEALIRYCHKERGYIGPAQFIDTLEKNNLIRYIDLFVFEEVCRQLETWKKKKMFLPVISINFSRLTLVEKDILASMESIISRYDVSKKHIEIEITESMASMGKSILYQASTDLYKAGFAISLDDFGTKYTNLAILADLDFSMLKVDRSLIGELSTGASHRVIMKNIISMCQELDINILAEGIENKDQEEILQTMECQLGQGYLYGKPMPMDEFNRKYIETNPYK